MKQYYIYRYKTSEEKPHLVFGIPYTWGSINNAKIRIHVKHNQDDVQKRLRCKFTLYG